MAHPDYMTELRADGYTNIVCRHCGSRVLCDNLVQDIVHLPYCLVTRRRFMRAVGQAMNVFCRRPPAPLPEYMAA